MFGDTIIALSTPPGSSGIAVIRISGPEAVPILDRLSPGAGSWTPRTIHECMLKDSGGRFLDNAAAVVMRAPRSYTGEDMAEIYCHGNMNIVSRITEEATVAGARQAQPGEFTRRAFMSGKMDLAQAEAVADLIAAETDLQRRIALDHVSGALSKRVRGIEEALLDQLVLVEAAIDFSQEDIETYSPEDLSRVSRETREKIAAMLESETAGEKLRDGIRVTITGPRNAGKSSLYNALIGEERAIVSPVPGTTRDVLRERIHIGGFTFYLEDTAGLAETSCEIEATGISRGRAAAVAADLVMFVADGSVPWDGEVERELEESEGRNTIVVLNKSDLGTPRRPGRGIGAERTVVTSAVTGEGLDELRGMIFRCTAEGEATELARERVAVNMRQAAALRRGIEALERLEFELSRGSPAEILSVEIREAAGACSEVTGRLITEDLLDSIFGRFCIGK
jgi:tRNA modification GTPase